MLVELYAYLNGTDVNEEFTGTEDDCTVWTAKKVSELVEYFPKDNIYQSNSQALAAHPLDRIIYTNTKNYMIGVRFNP